MYKEENKMENQKENVSQKEEVKIPEFLQAKKDVVGAPEFKYIKCDSYKRSWKSLRELDELIGSIMARDEEPSKIKITYQIKVSTDNKTEQIKGTISTDCLRDHVE